MARPTRKTSTRSALLGITVPWITAAVLQHPSSLHAHLMQRHGISRRRAGTLVQQLLAAQWLVATGTARKPMFKPGALRQVVQHYKLEGLQEDQPWRRDFAPYFELPTEVRRMAQHVFTELLNNAIEHSGGTRVTVSLRQTPVHLQLLVSDDGCGLFERIAHSFAITEPRLAMFELSKGKLTSQPDRHAGHGLFFASRMADVFDVHANGAAFQHRAWADQTWRDTRASAHQGTSVYLAIALDTPRTLDSVLRAHSAHSEDGASYSFDRTDVPLALLSGGEMLMSRADARRVAGRLGSFKQASIDFSGIAAIGHGFADELFRVLKREQPELLLTPKKMAPAVGAMLASVAG